MACETLHHTIPGHPDKSGADADTAFVSEAPDYFYEKDPFSDDIKLKCQKCISYFYNILYEYSLHNTAYTKLFLAYEFLLALCFSQFICERVFIKMRLIKKRLRFTMSDDLSETLMLISCEKYLSNKISPDDIIENLAKRFHYIYL